MIISPNVKSLLVRIFDSFMEALFPARCLGCDSFFCFRKNNDLLINLEEEEKISSSDINKIFIKELAPFVCQTCLTDFIPIKSPICTCCGIMFKSDQGIDHVCGECLKSPKWFLTARSVGVYDKIMMNLIHCLKYKGKLQLAKPLGRLLFFTYMKFWENDTIDLILPVPLHKKRFRKRGFNQAYLLIRYWQELFCKNKIQKSEIDYKALIRSRWTTPQVGLDRKSRLENIINAFTITDTSRIKGKNILLVDDVYTTGATANECAKVLIRGGANQVDILTLARAI